MQTYSHFLVNAAMTTPLQRHGYIVHTPAFLMGAVLPDLPFFLLTLLGEIYFRWIVTPPTGESPMIYMHFTLFFTDPLWIISHNFFHAPLILGALGLLGYVALRSGRQWGAMLGWLALGAALHTFVDIFTHNSDGPLIFFPFNWRFRFSSPVSYWEAAHFGQIFMVLEHLLDLGLVIYLILQWRRRRLIQGIDDEQTQ